MILDEQRLAVTRDTAARITGLSRRRLNRWARTDFLAPSTDDQLTPGRRIRFYDFLDLLGLMVAAQLIERGVPLPHIRQIVSHLRARGYEQPLAQLTWATHGKRVYFQHPDGSWEGDLRPRQTVLSQVLNLELLRAEIREKARRPSALAGTIERRRGALGNKQVLAGTRVPVETVRRYLDHGKSTAEILRSFPVLSEEDIEAVRNTSVA
ncbi:MAG: hypothetical protein DLM60_09750 [Pseudonocardiales bacterium]|nr:DUF433 domain-containing protein [Actinomycetota bacterium]PZS19731.1 MAG: hypothetical protein DLM60_09750 [Pseudonocardiales bacterium]